MIAFGTRGGEARAESSWSLSKHARDNLTAYTFLAPFLIIFLVFLAFPVGYSFYLAVHEKPPESPYAFSDLDFVGFAQFSRLFQDTEFWWSILMTLYYAALIIPSGIAASLALALLLNNRLRGVGIYRSAFFMPYVLDMLVVGIVWTLIYSPGQGILVRILEGIGISAFTEKGLLGTPWTAMPSVVFANVLKGAGFGMILYLSAIQNISPSLYEAASIDGASPWQRFTRITLPLVKPITFFMVVIGTIGALNAFVDVYAMTGGGPNVNIPLAERSLGVTSVTGYYLFETFYTSQNYGYASAMSIVLLVLTILISLVNRRFLGTRTA